MNFIVAALTEFVVWILGAALAEKLFSWVRMWMFYALIAVIAVIAFATR